jgi:phosphoribosyl 1,2-cyclic phosphate phosphodiesterase
LSLEQALAIVERLKPRRALFTHVAHELGHEATNARLPAHVRLAYDGLKLEL